ncbi:hypothetical protein DFH94DRAFT_42732 [Russula ochroleuca]|uniref:Uncharacterized protein n=1 Tax=Russula ochroleuca TaxID=152965 RepID=A0A9P5T898_9AGAM|nr:hypothetical protein DFH94DRAFT_42732 [Russula ochroleuca]
MEIDLYLPSFRTMRKRSRSRSPTPCEYDRPLKRLSVRALAVGDSAREPPPSFTPPQPTSLSSSAQVQTSSAILLVPGPAQSAYIRVADADGSIQDEWVTLTRNLTLLSARGSTEVEVDISGSREETMMNLDEVPQPSTLLHPHPQHFHHGVQESPDVYIGHMAPQLLNLHTNAPTMGLPSSRITPPAAVAFLRAPSPPTMPTPPLCSTPLPSHSAFSAAGMGTPLLTRQELQQPQLLLQGSTRRSRFTMGPRPDCDKCRLGVPGHYAHFD